MLTSTVFGTLLTGGLPELLVVIEGDEVRSARDANMAVLKREKWNVLVDLIQSGQPGRA